MTRTSFHPYILFAAALLMMASCKKDELTVVSTANPHTCEKRIVELDMDSLLQCQNPPPGQADLELTICDCDTIAFIPMNVPPQYEFEGWTIDQGLDNVHQDALILDTITVASELWMTFDNVGPGHEHLLFRVHTEHCE